jgi:cysteine desulfurase/selenocysteine lyase
MTTTTAPLDVETVRKDFPILSRLVHGDKPLVYLDNAATSQKPRQVLDAIVGYYEKHNANVHRGIHTLAEEATALYEGARDKVAAFIGAPSRDEVVFTKNSSEAMNLVARVLGDAGPGYRVGPGDEIVITEMEHHSNIVPWHQLAERTGATVKWFQITDDGRLDLSTLDSVITERTKIVSMVHVSNLLGTINPVEKVVARAREVGALVLLDACQSVGQVPIDVAALGVDIVSGTGRKWLRGPRGSGFLVVRRSVLPSLRPRQVDLRSGTWTSPSEFELRPDARVFELWESSYADRLGLLAAVRYALSLGVPAIAAEVRARAEYLRAALSSVPGVRVHDLGEDRCGIVSFTVEGRTPAEVESHLAAHEVTVSTTGVTSTQYDMTRRALPEVVRASPHYFVSESQLDEAVAALRP